MLLKAALAIAILVAVLLTVAWVVSANQPRVFICSDSLKADTELLCRLWTIGDGWLRTPQQASTTMRISEDEVPDVPFRLPGASMVLAATEGSLIFGRVERTSKRTLADWSCRVAGDPIVVLPLWLLLAMSLGVSALIAGLFGVRRHRRSHRRDENTCTECGYLLIGLTSSRCPECGTSFEDTPGRCGGLPAGMTADGDCIRHSE